MFRLITVLAFPVVIAVVVFLYINRQPEAAKQVRKGFKKINKKRQQLKKVGKR